MLAIFPWMTRGEAASLHVADRDRTGSASPTGQVEKNAWKLLPSSDHRDLRFCMPPSIERLAPAVDPTVG